MNSNLNNGVSMFTLQNSRGEVVDLDSDDLFGYTPTGLGAVFSNSYSQYESYFKPTKKTIQQGQMSLNILFGSVESQSYQTFSDFASFLAYEPLTLIYTTKSGSWYRDAVLSSLTKTEIGGTTVIQVDRLVEQFTIDFINPWYNNKKAFKPHYDEDDGIKTYGKNYNNAAYQNAVPDDTAKVGLAVVSHAVVGKIDDPSVTSTTSAYGYYRSRPDQQIKDFYVYHESSVKGDEKFLIAQNNSEYYGVQSGGSPAITTIQGPCYKNPTWIVFKDGEKISKGGFFVNLTNDQTLVISSYPEDQYMRVYEPNGEYSDVSQLQDFTKDNLTKVPIGESTILFYVDEETEVSLSFKEERLLV